MKTLQVDKIKSFILGMAPTRRELVKHILCNVSGRITPEDFDQNARKFRGQYSTAIAEWIRNENVEVINGRYYVTEQGRKVKNLYFLTPETKVKHLEKRLARLRENYYDVYDENRELRQEVKVLRNKFNDILDVIEE